jgi:hypothetical protein
VKKFKEILEEQNSETQDLTPAKINVNALTQAKSVDEALALATDFVPQLNKKLLSSEVGLPIEKKEKWLKTIDESLHATEIAPQRRTMTEKTASVLQQNRFPTAGAKFHQAILESSVYTYQLIDETFAYEEKKLELEKDFYNYQKNAANLEERQGRGLDTFLEERDLAIEKLKLTKAIMSLKSQEKSLQNKREELMEWSDIKKDLYQEAVMNKEIWSPDTIDGDVGLQEIPLAMRHLQNFLMLKQNPSEGDISSVLNIEGLALTAIKQGMKNGRLGLYMSQMSEAQIKLVFLHIFGWDVLVVRADGKICISDEYKGVLLEYPETLDGFGV